MPENHTNLLSAIPDMNRLLAHPLLADLPRERAKYAAGKYLSNLRDSIRAGVATEAPSPDDCAMRIRADALDTCRLRRRKVVNATGVILHTNLGRAPLGATLWDTITQACSGYCNLEYDVDTGRRGDRNAPVESLLCALTGAQAAMVVNNNAAAVYLMLCALAKGKRVAISRGELVEIGGSFRIPEIMEQSGAELVEVGATNKTRLADYIGAVGQKDASILMKVHTSNYRIVGFTESVSAAELAAWGRQKGLPVLYDMGSCFLTEAVRLALHPGEVAHTNDAAHTSGATHTSGIPQAHGTSHPADTGNVTLSEESAQSAIASGVDLLCFSGDKLLGSVQSGILVGRKDFIEILKKHPVARALRPDKLALSALEATLLLYRYPEEAARSIPVLAMIGARPDDLRQRAEALALALADAIAEAPTEAQAEAQAEVRGEAPTEAQAEVRAKARTGARAEAQPEAWAVASRRWEIGLVEVADEVGGGAMPNVRLPGWAVSLKPVAAQGTAHGAAQQSTGHGAAQQSTAQGIVQSTAQGAPRSADELAARLRHGPVPVVVRLHDGMALLSLRTVQPDEEALLLTALCGALVAQCPS